jgi:hypothetical protein
MSRSSSKWPDRIHIQEPQYRIVIFHRFPFGDNDPSQVISIILYGQWCLFESQEAKHEVRIILWNSSPDGVVDHDVLADGIREEVLD